MQRKSTLNVKAVNLRFWFDLFTVKPCDHAIIFQYDKCHIYILMPLESEQIDCTVLPVWCTSISDIRIITFVTDSSPIHRLKKVHILCMTKFGMLVR